MEAEIKQNLIDAGCPEASAEDMARLYQNGRTAEVMRKLRLFRCELMEELHRSQRKVDCLDYLIRQTKREIKTTSERRETT